MFQAKKTRWRNLENAAKIFPATSNKKDERVFRFVCELKEEVEPGALQGALDLCIQEFPMFSCVLRKGLFWNYFESTDIQPKVREEYKVPCSQLYVRDQKSLLFEVTYFGKRINCEMYHALTDGTGALAFFRVLVYHYLREAHPEEVRGPVASVLADATAEEMEEDSFEKYYGEGREVTDIPAYRSFQLRYRRLEYGSLRLIQGTLSVKEALSQARQRGVTLTVFLTAVYLCAIAKELAPRQKNKIVSLMVPVNLRSYFPSKSMRNFFWWIDIGYNFEGWDGDLEKVVSFVGGFFKKELTRERMAARIYGLMKFERNPLVRILPLALKQAALYLGTNMKPSGNTAIFSNIGKIVMPQECSPFLEQFEVFTSTPKVELCMCSYGDKLSLSFTSSYVDTRIERNFFRILTDLGIKAEISAWSPEEGGGAE
ncbi:hypothetical protein [Cuneatibacter caecimuris]|uniref:NRPS condensation-like uncharacterized protein n=1 Tax=Cuneatibacter caecimuris TaxID=1796618 RepID=A0A4Q7PIY8_9FIRM|nr:hypothetical protein [Cuneatibacter caecimuris]RZT00602.1 NRPS condensation-like uncharacterized protein [Cuneatibacter caecimuris]